MTSQPDTCAVPGKVAAVSTAPARMVWMDQLRGLAILMVLTFHAETVMARFALHRHEPLSEALAAFAPFRMPLLMFLSGMLLARSLAKPTGAFFNGKLRGIGWPYLLWSVAFLATSAQLTAHTFSLIFWSSPTYLWYLWFLLAYYVGAWLMRALRIPPEVGLILGVVASLGPDSYRFSRFGFLFVFFMAGHIFTLRRRPLPTGAARPWLTAASGLVVLAGAYASWSGRVLQYQAAWIIVPAAGVLLALLLRSHTSGSGYISRSLRYVGHDSIVFYVTHFLVAWVACWWLRWAGVDSPTIMYPIAVLAAVAAGLAMTWARHRSRLVDGLFQLPDRKPAKAVQAVAPVARA